MDEKIINEIKLYANEELAKHHLRFFKTGKGEYGEGDLFLGLKVPSVRLISKKFFKDVQISDLEKLIKNQYHEIRLAALFMMILKYDKGDNSTKSQIFDLYVNSANYVNNWDLVDLSAPNIFGSFVFDSTDKLWEFAKKDHLWSQRISVVASHYFIRKNNFKPTLELSEYFLPHKHDLMHKACGWMLREVGKRDVNELYGFLDKFYKVMPRTMLRYSIERLDADKKKHYMGK